MTMLVVGIDNHEQTTRTDTVVVTADQLVDDGDGVTPTESTEMDRFAVTLDGGKRLQQSQTVTPGEGEPSTAVSTPPTEQPSRSRTRPSAKASEDL